MDNAIIYHASLERFLSQDKNEPASLEAGYAQLDAILSMVSDTMQDQEEPGDA